MNNGLSILIPVYNGDALPLAQILHQQGRDTGIPFEIRVYDDGSPNFDNTNEYIDELEFASFTRLEENVGRAAIRQRLAKDAQYPRLLFLDADVWPASNSFLKTYTEFYMSSPDVVCGGISYANNPPEAAKMLRYVYGLNREATSANLRNERPHFVVTANLLISKEVFNQVNTSTERTYGEDLLISQNLKAQEVEVTHIDNPVEHRGIEDSIEYLKKSEEALQHIVRLEKSGTIAGDLTNLQKRYLKFKRNRTLWFYLGFAKLFGGLIRKNLLSENPNLRMFDLYRLAYYSKEKKHA